MARTHDRRDNRSGAAARASGQAGAAHGPAHTTYSVLAVQELIEHDKELARGERQLAVESLVLHHGDREWNAPTRLRDLFRNSAPNTYPCGP